MSQFNLKPEQFSRSIHSTALIGFDELFKQIQELDSQKTNPKTNFPAYDIIRMSVDEFVIKLAVAGYSKSDISVSLDSGKLSVVGVVVKTKETLELEELLDSLLEKYPEYLHKGISQRDFKREFTLADTVEVSDVKLSEGMLSIHLTNIIPESKRPKKFQIR